MHHNNMDTLYGISQADGKCNIIFLQAILMSIFGNFCLFKRETSLLLLFLLFQQNFSKFFLNVRPTITRVALTGGGVKGLTFIGAYQALIENGLISGIEDCAGSSIGAVAAAFWAVGMPANQFRQSMLEANFKSFIGEPAGSFFEKNQPGSLPISRTGLPFEHWVRDQLVTSVSQFLDTINPVDLPAELLELKERLHNNSQAPFSFLDLSHLNQYDCKIFKKLSVTATLHPQGTLSVFNAQCSPNVDIPKALRASISLPGLLTPAAIKLSPGLSTNCYMDGSITNNIPANVFDADAQGNFINNHKKDQTLIFAFKDNGNNLKKTPMHRALYGTRIDEVNKGLRPVLYNPNVLEKLVLNYFFPLIFGLQTPEKMTDTIEQGYQRIREEYPLRTVVLGCGPVKPIDFGQAQKFSRTLLAFGYLDTFQYLLNHELFQSITIDKHHLPHLLFSYFNIIYTAVITGANKKINDDVLYQEGLDFLKQCPKHPLSCAEAEPDPYQVTLHFIKEKAEENLNSVAAFSLTRAVEYYLHQIELAQLREEIVDKSQELEDKTKRTHLRSFFYQKPNRPSPEKIDEALEQLTNFAGNPLIQKKDGVRIK